MSRNPWTPCNCGAEDCPRCFPGRKPEPPPFEGYMTSCDDCTLVQAAEAEGRCTRGEEFRFKGCKPMGGYPPF